LPHEPHEATAYASVYKFSHDVAPARAALGAGGCTDCHASNAGFFDRPVLAVAFSPDDGKPRWMPNHEILGMSAAAVRLGAFREGWLKPVTYAVMALMAAVAVLLGLRGWLVRQGVCPPAMARNLSWLALAALVVGALIAAREGGLIEYMTLRRFTLDANHFWVACFALAFGLVLALQRAGTPKWLAGAIWLLLVATGACGGLVLLKWSALETITRLAYTGFDLGVALLALASAVALLLRLAALPPSGGSGRPAETAALA
jgi:hypothetical protein